MNIIQIKLESLDNRFITVGHNQQTLYKNIIKNELLTFEVEFLKSENLLWLQLDNSSNVSVNIEWITMFELGKERLVYLGNLKTLDNSYQSQIIIPNSTWILTYNYPVFSWLHRTLNHGWLIGHH